MSFSALSLAALVLLACRSPVVEAGGPPLASGPWGPRQPRAAPGAAVISGDNARFTVLTPRLIRMEYRSHASRSAGEDGQERQFEDRATIAVINRRLIVPPFKQESTGGVLAIETDDVRLTYKEGNAFSPTTLEVAPVDNGSSGGGGGSAFTSWHYGQSDDHNLLGTIRTLDGVGVVPLNCTELAVSNPNGERHCEWGVISRGGWAVVDDSDNYALDDATDWWAGPNSNDIDLYLFAHGSDYKGALADFHAISGKASMSPRYALGNWFTRWYDYDSVGVRETVDEFALHAVPLDVFVLDMNFHTKHGWTGYTFDERLFPYPQDDLGALKKRGLATAVNVHDAQGVMASEVKYADMCDAVNRARAADGGLKPIDCHAGEAVPFNISDRSAVLALEDIVLSDLERIGVDFFWIDWQQGESGHGAPGDKANPTIWTAHNRVTDHSRRGEDTRGMTLARFGGLGAHRYQVGFSGDVNPVTWATLAFQPYFTLTAANVGYSRWSHDLVGPADDPELHVRWLQWGSVSGVTRMHDRGMSAGGCAGDGVEESNRCYVVQPWLLNADMFAAARGALRYRTALLPYLATAMRAAFDDGVPLLRPMYYEWPNCDNAYRADQFGNFSQYTLGDDIIAAPVVSRANKTTGLAAFKFWVPPGRFVSTISGEFFEGEADCGTKTTMAATIDDVPMFVRAGAVVPMLPVPLGGEGVFGLAAAAHTLPVVEFAVYLDAGGGMTSGEGTLYEDDGISTAYVTNASVAHTTLKWSLDAASGLFKVNIERVGNGDAKWAPLQRSYVIKLINSPPAASYAVVVAGKLSPHEATPSASLHYSGDEATLRIAIEEAALNRTPSSSTYHTLDVSLNLACPPDANSSTDCGISCLGGVKGALRRARAAKRILNDARSCPGEGTGGVPPTGKLQILASSGSALSHLAAAADGDDGARRDVGEFWEVVHELPRRLAEAAEEVRTFEHIGPARRQRALALLELAAEEALTLAGEDEMLVSMSRLM